MSTVRKESFIITGLAVRTSNGNGQAMADIGALWNRFLSDNTLIKIPGKLDDHIYSVYTDYEGDYTKPYTVILGCRTIASDNIPGGMVQRFFPEAKYHHKVIKGNILEGAVYKAWEEVWNSNLPRAYTADFEVYGEKAANPTDAEIDLYISIAS
jgi:predicted transcriptional regulator YdeE